MSLDDKCTTQRKCPAGYRELDSVKSVKFSSKVLETSYGGTKTPVKLKSLNSKEVTRDTLKPIIQQQLLHSPVRPDMSRGDTTSIFHNVSSSPVFKTPTNRRTLRCSLPSNHILETPDCFNKVQLETPTSMTRRRTVDNVYSSSDDGEDNSVTVAVRVRPFTAREKSDPNLQCVVEMSGQQTTVSTLTGQQFDFAYAYSFWSFDRHHLEFADQEYVYKTLASPLLTKAFQGYNTCLFAYGQTGSGKSYTVMGQNEDVGIIPRFCEELFARKESLSDVEVNVEISYFEIYNEKIHDLLGSSKDNGDKKIALKVREHPTQGPYVEGLSNYVVNSFEDIQGWINLGNKQRATASTGMNDKSSRSHSVFTIVMTQTRTECIQGEDHEHSTTSKINLIDLAGSERQSTAQTSGLRLREGASINKSLHTLGKVISMLSEQSTSTAKKKKFFIPYRDSVLTWLLRESLGGNSKTTMIATISPANLHMEETLSTLRYAKQASTIVNTARINEDPKARIIRELRAEIDKLRCLNTGSVRLEDDSDNTMSALTEIGLLKEQLKLKELEMEDAQRSWHEKLKKSEIMKQQEVRTLEKSGVALKLDNNLPNLVNLNEDAQLTEMLLYVLKAGVTHVGRMKATSTADIQLHGALIADNHCTIKNDGYIVSIIPVNGAPVYINGDLITEKITLHHGDRVILGGDHYFRFNHPKEAVKVQRVQTGQIKDFEFAKNELIRVQDSKLQAELENARLETQKEMEKEVDRAKQQAERELSLQRQEYEDRLKELEKQLHKQNEDMLQTNRGRQDAQTVIDKLEKEKSKLEREVKKVNRICTEMQTASTSMQAPDLSKRKHSTILDQLAKVKGKISEEVDRLEAMKQRRGITTVSTVTQMSARKDLYKISILLREANNISQDLKKNTIFSREDFSESDNILIRVINTKLGITTFWTLGKFEEKLIRMRELDHQRDGNVVSLDTDDVFYDPADSWEKSSRITSSPAKSHQLLSRVQHRERVSTCNSLRESLASFTSTNKSMSTSSNGNSSTSEAMQDENCKESQYPGTHVMSICRDLISANMDRFDTDNSMRQSLPDQVLHQCECIKMVVATMLDVYEQCSESGKIFTQNEVVHLGSVQMTVSTDLLLHHCDVWCRISQAKENELRNNIFTTVKRMGKYIVLFLQGCQNDINSMVQESASNVLDCVFWLCKMCGELSLATNSCLMSLMNDNGLSSDRCQLGHDVRHVFITGSDNCLDKALQSGVKSVEESKFKVQGLSDTWNKAISKISQKVLEYIEIVSATSLILLIKVQDAQIDIDTSLRESSSSRTDSYYNHHYSRSRRLVTHISSLVDGICSLSDVALHATQGMETDSGKFHECTEQISKSSQKLFIASSTIEDNDTSTMSDSQCEQLEFVTNDVQQAADKLLELVQDKGVARNKRRLPASPVKSHFQQRNRVEMKMSLQ